MHWVSTGLMLPRSCPWARLFPLMNSSEYPLYISVVPEGHSGIRSFWLCLVNRKPSISGASVQGPGRPATPLAPGGPRMPARPVNTRKRVISEWEHFAALSPAVCSSVRCFSGELHELLTVTDLQPLAALTVSPSVWLNKSIKKNLLRIKQLKPNQALWKGLGLIIINKLIHQTLRKTDDPQDLQTS